MPLSIAVSRYNRILVQNCYPMYLAPPLGLKPPDLCNDPWWRKTRMMGLSGLERRERILMIRSAVLLQYTRVTDRRKELAWHIRAIAYPPMIRHFLLDSHTRPTRAVLSPGNRANMLCKFRYVKSVRNFMWKLCYRKDDRTMRPIRGCPEKMRDSLTTPTATIHKIFHGLLLRSPYECSYKIWSP